MAEMQTAERAANVERDMTQTHDANSLDLKIPVSAADHAIGAETAAVTLIEYGDFDCPFCARAYPVVKELVQHFGAKLRFVFRHNPRGEQHPYARVAAEAAEAAGLQGKFWQMHDLLFERQKDSLEERDLAGYARELGLDVERFTSDLRSPQVVKRVKEDEIGGLRSAVIGTPTFFVNGRHFRDKPDFETLAAAIQAQLPKPRPAKASAKAFRRRDGTGHLDPAYQKFLLSESGASRSDDDDRAFIGGSHSNDALAEQLGEEFVESATSGQDDGDDRFDQVVPEENGGPFVESDGAIEFADDDDPPNIEEAPPEPFPKT
jgi:protein-disulfide isomerase